MKPTMLSYIQQEQDVLLKILDAYETIVVPDNFIQKEKEILVLATGSSINAALSVKHFVQDTLDVRINIQEPFNYMHYEKVNPDIAMVVGISQSGQSTATIDAINSLKYLKVPTVAVTTIAKSEITEVVDHVLLVKSGEERVGYVTMGYVATILELYLHTMKIANLEQNVEKDLLKKLRESILSINKIQEDTVAFFEANREAFKDAVRFTAVGYGPNFGTVKEMETKFSETVRVPSSGYDLEAYMHGPYLEVNPSHHIFFVMSRSNIEEKAELLYEYEKKHANTYRIDYENRSQKNVLYVETQLPETMTPLVNVIPFQILCWYIAKEKGIDLTQRIYTDFSQAVKSKTKVQNYV